MTTKHSLTAAEIRSRFKIGDSVIVTLYNHYANIEKEKVTMTITDIDDNDTICTIQLDNWWYDNRRVKFHTFGEFDMPEIEPGMWAKDRNGDSWLAIKTSKDAPKIEWIKAPVHTYENTQYFIDNIVDLHDADNVYWDRNKQTQLKELQQKQRELAKELEALNQQIQALNQ
jgi:hypothetical protein